MIQLSILGIFGVGTREIMVMLMFIPFPLVFILFVSSLRKVLERCSYENRTIKPGQVWLLLIPFFNLGWQFVVLTKVSQSLENEFNSRNIQKGPAPGKSIGMAVCILAIFCTIPIIMNYTALPCLICWIIYWAKISSYSKELANSQPNSTVW